jgi:hypothetical protein
MPDGDLAGDNKRRGRRRRSQRGAPPDPLLSAPLRDVVQSLGIDRWDVVIIGDGSGSTWDKACGWSAVAIERESSLRTTFYGGLSGGNVNLAELLPYLQALLWYTSVNGPKLQAKLKRRPRLHIVTDSRLAADQGNGRARRNVNGEIWAAIDAVALRGYDLRWHWMGRERTGLNVLTDHLSKAARRAIADVKLPKDTSVHDLNPSE